MAWRRRRHSRTNTDGQDNGQDRDTRRGHPQEPPLSSSRWRDADDSPEPAVPFLAIATLAAGCLRRVDGVSGQRAGTRLEEAGCCEDAATHQFHGALLAREPAAARDSFKRHRLAALASGDLCLLRFDDSGGHSSSKWACPKHQLSRAGSTADLPLRNVRGGTTAHRAASRRRMPALAADKICLARLAML